MLTAGNFSAAFLFSVLTEIASKRELEPSRGCSKISVSTDSQEMLKDESGGLETDVPMRFSRP